MKPYRIVTDFEEVPDLKCKWDELLSLDDSLSAFQSYDYNYLAWTKLLSHDPGNSLFVVLCADSDDGSFRIENLIAVLPFYIDRKKTLRFINDKHSDFCDVVAPYQRHTFEIFSTLCEIVEAESSINQLYLINHRSASTTTSYLNLILGHYAFISSSLQNTQLNLPRSEEFPNDLAHLNSSGRRRLRGILNRTAHLDQSIISHEAGFDFPEDQINALRDHMISIGIRSRNFLNDGFVGFMKGLYESGLVLLNCVRDKDELVGASVILTRGNDYLFWIDLYRDVPLVNLSSYLKFIQSTVSKSDMRVSFGRGNYDYKIRNFKPTPENLLCFYHTRSFARYSFYLAKEFLRTYLRPAFRSLKYQKLEPLRRRLFPIYHRTLRTR